jgi:hypothetical protein
VRFWQAKTDDYAERQRRRPIHQPRGAIGHIGNGGNRLTPRPWPRPQRREHDRVAVLLVTQSAALVAGLVAQELLQHGDVRCDSEASCAGPVTKASLLTT